MRIRAPFKVAYDGPFTFRVWGYGLGYLPMQILGWGYNLRGCASWLPLGRVWKLNRRDQMEIR